MAARRFAPLLLALALAIVPAARAATYVVDPSGNDGSSGDPTPADNTADVSVEVSDESDF